MFIALEIKCIFAKGETRAKEYLKQTHETKRPLPNKVAHAAAKPETLFLLDCSILVRLSAMSPLKGQNSFVKFNQASRER